MVKMEKGGLWLGSPSHQRKNEATMSNWWSLSNPTCTKTEATFTFLAYEMLGERVGKRIHDNARLVL
jgi:hypothetical protein